LACVALEFGLKDYYLSMNLSGKPWGAMGLKSQLL